MGKAKRKPAPKPARKVPRTMTAEKRNAKGELVLKQYGSTKRSKQNPLRLTDGLEHPVTVTRVNPADLIDRGRAAVLED